LGATTLKRRAALAQRSLNVVQFLASRAHVVHLVASGMLLNILNLFPDFFKLGFKFNNYRRYFTARSFIAKSGNLAKYFLQKKIHTPSDSLTAFA
jgi:hypothetical protein